MGEAGTGERRDPSRVLVGNLRERDFLEDLSIDRKIILSWILKKLVRRPWTGPICVRIETNGGLF
jgi:hypothetical protein